MAVGTTDRDWVPEYCYGHSRNSMLMVAVGPEFVGLNWAFDGVATLKHDPEPSHRPGNKETATTTIGGLWPDEPLPSTKGPYQQPTRGDNSHGNSHRQPSHRSRPGRP